MQSVKAGECPQRVDGGLLIHVAPRHPAQLGVDQRHQLIERAAVALAPAL